MLSLDDRAGNALITVAVFMLGAAILYLARGAFLILFLSLLFAYLLDPSPRGPESAGIQSPLDEPPLKPVAEGLSRYF